MEDWEEDEKIASLLSKEPAVKGNWDDEDVDENDVKDSWEDDDEPAPPVKVSELSLDTFRMLQSLEWEPSGSFYQSNVARNGQNGVPGPGRINYSQEIADPTLPHNPRINYSQEIADA